MLKKILNKNLKSEFSRNVLTLFSGTTIAQIIPFIVSPILTRIYGPEDFGLLALYTAVYTLISIVATMQYESAIMLPKQDVDAINIVALCLKINIFISLTSLLICILFNEQIAIWVGDIRLAPWLYLVPFSVFISGLYNTLNYWNSRKKQYKRLAIRTVTQSFTTAFVKLTMGLAGALNSGLISGTIIGQTTATSVLTWLTLKEDKKLLNKVNKYRTNVNARIYKNFPKYTAWQGFFDMFNSTGTAIIITTILGSGTLGLYSFTLSLLQKPLQLIGSSISQVYYQKASELHNVGNNIWKITKKLILRLLFIAIIVYTPVAIIGPKLFSFVFGKDWAEAGVYAQLMLPWLVIRFILSPITSSVNIMGKQKAFFSLTLIINVLFPLILYYCLRINISFSISLFVVSLITSIYFSIIIFWIRYLLINERDNINK